MFFCVNSYFSKFTKKYLINNKISYVFFRYIGIYDLVLVCVPFILQFYVNDTFVILLVRCINAFRFLRNIGMNYNVCIFLF